MKNRIYSTIENAYKGAERVGAKSFGSDYYAYANKVDEIIASTYKSASARTFAKWNLAKLDKTLCALECAPNGAYKWTAIGHFDSDGLLYPMGTEAQAKVIKPRTRKPVGGKGKSALQLELDTLAGTGDNSNAHKIMCKHGLKNSKSDEYQAVWKGYWWTIR